MARIALGPNGLTTGRTVLVGLTSLVPLAATPLAGVALVNGLQDFITVGVPNDGRLHQYYVSGTKVISSNETGGNTFATYTSLGQPEAIALCPGARITGQTTNFVVCLCDPGTTLKVNQGSALTAGASVLIAAISGG